MHSQGLGSQRNSRLLQVAALPGSAWPLPKPDDKDTHFYLSSKVVWRHSKSFSVLIMVIKGTALLRTVTIMPINFRYYAHMHTHTLHYFLFSRPVFLLLLFSSLQMLSCLAPALSPCKNYHAGSQAFARVLDFLLVTTWIIIPTMLSYNEHNSRHSTTDTVKIRSK